jgi:hypothetical protein
VSAVRVPKNAVRQSGDRFDDMLAIVEHDKDSFVVQEINDARKRIIRA